MIFLEQTPMLSENIYELDLSWNKKLTNKWQSILEQWHVVQKNMRH
jgi:hypothetical protein